MIPSHPPRINFPRFLFQILYPYHSFPSTHSSLFLSTTPPRLPYFHYFLLLPLHFLFRKEKTSKSQQPKRTKQDTVIRQKPCYGAWTKQAYRRKKVLRASKRVGDTPVPTIKSPVKSSS